MDNCPKLYLCQMGMKDLETKLGYQLAVPCRKTVYLRETTFPEILCFGSLFSHFLGEFLACCASMNEMPRVKSEDEIRRDLGVGRFIFRTGYNMELLNSPAIC